jgi:hypothetical protein
MRLACELRDTINEFAGDAAKLARRMIHKQCLFGTVLVKEATRKLNSKRGVLFHAE